MLYFEEAIVRTYYRDKKKENPFNQINLKKDSKFNPNPEEPEKVGVVRLHELKNFINKLDGSELKELEAKYNELQEENLQLKEEVESLKKVAEDLASDVNKLTNEKTTLQENLLTAEAKNEEIIELQKEHEEKIEKKASEIKRLNYELNNEKDYSKALLVVRSDFLKQGRFSRFFKVEPESSKAIGKILKELPEAEVEVEPKPTEE